MSSRHVSVLYNDIDLLDLYRARQAQSLLTQKGGLYESIFANPIKVPNTECNSSQIFAEINLPCSKKKTTLVIERNQRKYARNLELFTLDWPTETLTPSLCIVYAVAAKSVYGGKPVMYLKRTDLKALRPIGEMDKKIFDKLFKPVVTG